ncbi:hypothetical protein ACFFF5_04040 [Lederbergia wuyishanensis]|uniref:Flagellar hook-length control protein-like C-terminal domain-containing protein n=1 Tax=Lederbergia wuyishanensis TaxID=1347903 RepID=A0ABU0CZN0_9BACI|nr:hypothetical protein [Lederbergia wuyishanensis]MCJ8006248.1 hypothetical protein [Lederbergia wuyishanensis]MDQ0341617.1 hypothetical protein [Lederbergia wuyishanensis]
MVMQAVMRALLQNQENIPQGSIHFRNGQVFYGVIQRLFPNQHAEIKMGVHKLIARLEVPLAAGKGYWLQVTSNEGAPRLKLLNSNPMSNNESTTNLLQQLGLSNDKVNQSLVRLLMNEHIFLTKEDIVNAVQLLKQSQNLEEGLQIIKLMSQRNLPYNEGVFKSLIASGNNDSTEHLLKTLQASLILEENQLDSTGKEILKLLKSWDVEILPNNRENALLLLKQSLQRTGIFYENTLLDSEQNHELLKESMKPLLVQFLQESQSIQSESKSIAEQLLFRMNGFQLLSSENGPIHHLLYEIPIKLGDYPSEIAMQWSGKRTEDGKINSDFCRIIFYLDLEHLKETMVDMQVQNRIVSVTILNSSEELKNLSTDMLPAVISGLKELDYRLSSINFKTPDNYNKQDSKKNRYHSKQSYNGVDIRI